MLFFALPIVCGIMSFYTVGLVMSRFGRRLTDVPGSRSSHSKPTPRGGGLGIVLSTLAGGLIYWALESRAVVPGWAAFLASAALVSAVSWRDDLGSLSNSIRFAAHAVAAMVTMMFAGWFGTIQVPLFGQAHLGIFGILLTFLWIVGLTNAYNFMDGIDGLAGGQAVVAGLGWAILGWNAFQPEIALAGLLLAAGSGGFLFHNWPPARIFMGDVGSCFLGYTLAVLPLLFAPDPAADPFSAALPLTAALFVWPMLFDTAFTIIRRLRRGENIFTAHRSHLYQRMVIAGMSHAEVSLLYIGLSIIGAALGIAFFQGMCGSSLAVGLVLPLLCFGLWAGVALLERRKGLSRSPVRI
jgi:UDP-GlcNAc:undecaprenyl-phosphate/decaprenyl-phosphate GlcNAc-1-phosphate transferase